MQELGSTNHTHGRTPWDHISPLKSDFWCGLEVDHTILSPRPCHVPSVVYCRCRQHRQCATPRKCARRFQCG